MRSENRSRNFFLQFSASPRLCAKHIFGLIIIVAETGAVDKRCGMRFARQSITDRKYWIPDLASLVRDDGFWCCDTASFAGMTYSNCHKYVPFAQQRLVNIEIEIAIGIGIGLKNIDSDTDFDTDPDGILGMNQDIILTSTIKNFLCASSVKCILVEALQRLIIPSANSGIRLCIKLQLVFSQSDVEPVTEDTEIYGISAFDFPLQSVVVFTP
ncbi:MAG: hypothetical protein ABIL58_07840 [Pseudomonadota bacterium]